MKLPILFQSLKRIEGQEGRSKLLASQSELYVKLKEIKQAIADQHPMKADRMDLHIELTKNRHDPNFSEKAVGLHEQIIDLTASTNWGFLGRAFVLWTPVVEGYEKTHITLAFFGDYPVPELPTLIAIVNQVIAS